MVGVVYIMRWALYGAKESKLRFMGLLFVQFDQFKCSHHKKAFLPEFYQYISLYMVQKLRQDCYPVGYRGRLSISAMVHSFIKKIDTNINANHTSNQSII